MSVPVPIMSEEEARRGQVEGESGFGALATPRGPLPLRAMSVEARITGLFAETTVRQTFVNAHGTPLEASYIFPLPDRAAVTGFRLEVKGRVVEGKLAERGQAREEYEQALEAGHRAAIAEEERPGVFTMRVGNLPPGEAASVELRLCAQLPFEEGEATFRFPLVVAPRYIPGIPLAESVGDGTAPDTDAVPDASRISPPVLLPGFPSPVRLALAVSLDPGGARLSELRSALHLVEQRATSDGAGYRVALRDGERLDRDFILRFRLGGEALQSDLVLHPDEEGREGTFLLSLWPPAVPAGERPRDVLFVLDRSGSMEGWKLVAARRAVARMVDTLASQDRFAVYAFDDVIECPPGLGLELSAASDRQRFRAIEFLATLAARGGTELAEPLEAAAQRLAGGEPGRERVLVLVTDGQVGNEDQILRRLAPRLRGTRVFALGVDRAVNEAFLRRLAALGAGAFVLVESEARLDEVMQSLHRRLGAPLVSGLELEPSGLELSRGSLVPARPPDLFPGAPLFLLGRYRGAAGGVRLRGHLQSGEAWSDELVARPTSNRALPAIWARAQIRELEDRYQVMCDGSATADEGLERQIVETSLRFGVLSRFTAFLAVDRDEVVNRGGRGRRILQPVEPPEGWAPPPDAAAICASGIAAPGGAGAQQATLGRYVLGAPGPDGASVAQSAGVCGFEKSFALVSFGPELAQDAALVELFIAEGKLAVRVEHPWVAQLFDLGLADQRYYQTSELVPGPRASELTGLDTAESVAIVGRVLRALARVHAGGAVHGELGPETVAVPARGEVKLLGLGLGRVRRALAFRDGAAPRQAAFLAPELLAGAPGDPRSDLYGAGALLVFLLAGAAPARPFAPKAGLPPALVPVLARALAPDPAARFASAEEMLRDLEAAGFAIPAEPSPPPAYAPPPSEAEVPLPPLELAPYWQRLADELPRFGRQAIGAELAR